MRAALPQARKGLGQTSPNPAVGAVLVIDGKIVARGHHKRAGRAHAEIECLRSFKKPVPKSAILYVTLEPCSTTGRTGPCTDAIVEAGVRRLVIGATDPNPRHAGRGIELLKKAGLDVRAGVLAEECSALNEAYQQMDSDRASVCHRQMRDEPGWPIIRLRLARPDGSPAPPRAATRNNCARKSMRS